MKNILIFKAMTHKNTKHFDVLCLFSMNKYNYDLL